MHDTDLCPEIMGTGISMFTVHQLAKEFRKTELLRFCADSELEIDSEQDDRGSATLHIRRTSRYTYSMASSGTSSDTSRTQVSVALRSDENTRVISTFVLHVFE